MGYNAEGSRMKIAYSGGPAGRRSWRNRFGITVAMAAASALVLGACTPGADSEDSEGNKTLTVAVSSLGTMDFAPMTSEEDNEKSLMLLGDNLIGVDPKTSEFTSELAKSWSVSPDGLTWDFKLRPNIKFQKGYGTVTAEDVKWSWSQWADKHSTHDVRTVYQDAVGGSMDGFEIVNPLEFKLHAKHPVQLLPFVCSCTPAMTVFPKKYYAEKGKVADKNPIGTGPWEYVSSKPGDEIVFKRNPDYWGKKPQASKLVLKEIPDGAARLAQVKSGAVDLGQLDGSLSDEAAKDKTLTVRGIPHIVSAWVLLGGSYYGNKHLDRGAPWIQADDPDKGKAVREALSLAIDRDALLKIALQGHGKVTYGPMFQFPDLKLLNDPSWKLPAYDVALAKQKLAEGGYPNGFPITLESYAGDIDTATMTELIAGMWEKIGIKVKREQNEEGRLKQAESTYKTDGKAWIRLSTFNPDPVKSLSTTRDAPDISPKITYPPIDAAYEQMSSEPSLDKRYAITRDLVKEMEDNFVAPSLVSGDMLFVSSPKVTGWTPIPGVNTVNNLQTVTLK
jgi:peptide/nickel transport system substrate-binding protein